MASVSLWLAFSCPLFADLTVSVREAAVKTVTTPYVTTSLVVDGETVGDPVDSVGEPVESPEVPAMVLLLESDRDLATSLVKVRCKTAAVQAYSSGMYLISTPGTHEVQVDVISQEPLQWDDATLVVTIGAPPEPPKPDDPVDPDIPDEVPDKYGVGKVAYQMAPRDASISKYAEIYRRAGDFLFGIPSLKFIVSSNVTHSKDPGRSVTAWITQQYGLVQCADQSTCDKWVEWQSAVADALVESQQRRQFTRDDWYAAFNEIATALKAKVSQ